MRIEIHDAAAAWPIVEPLDLAVYTPAVMAEVPWRDVVWAHADHRVLAWNDSDELVCHVGVFLREGTSDGKGVRIGGIGGVMTLPSARGRGYASSAMRAAQEFLRTPCGCDFALLFCEPQTMPLYAALGWRQYRGEVLADQPQRHRERFFMDAMVFDLGQAPGAGRIDLCGLPW